MLDNRLNLFAAIERNTDQILESCEPVFGRRTTQEQKTQIERAQCPLDLTVPVAQVPWPVLDRLLAGKKLSEAV